MAGNGYLDLGQRQVLVVEDNRPTQALLSGVLRGLGFRRISVAEDGDAALRLIRTAPIDLLIVDIALGRQNGLALVRQVRNCPDPRIAGMGIVVVSAHATPTRVMEAGVQGVDGFVAKPITVSGLARRIGDALRAAARPRPASNPAEPPLLMI